MQPFVYESHHRRVVFGAGTIARLGEEIDRLGLRRVVLISTAGRAAECEQLAATLAGRVAGVFAGAVMHTPVSVTEKAVEQVASLDADGIVAMGGGSAIGLGKAVTLRRDLPQIVLPTTYAGSEMTPILGETRDGRKQTLRDSRIVPDTVIYDVDLTVSLPPAMSAASGMNAIAHAAEALYAADSNPVVALMAEEAIRTIANALPLIVRDPNNLEARSQALYGAWLAGMCLGAARMGVHHMLCHVLGGMFDLPHAETHAAILPHALAYNTKAAPGAMSRIARALGADDAAAGMDALAKRLGVHRSLQDLGMPRSGIARAADAAVLNPYSNPRPIEREAVGALIGRAWVGDPPHD